MWQGIGFQFVNIFLPTETACPLLYMKKKPKDLSTDICKLKQ